MKKEVYYYAGLNKKTMELFLSKAKLPLARALNCSVMTINRAIEDREVWETREYIIWKNIQPIPSKNKGNANNLIKL